MSGPGSRAAGTPRSQAATSTTPAARTQSVTYSHAMQFAAKPRFRTNQRPGAATPCRAGHNDASGGHLRCGLDATYTPLTARSPHSPAAHRLSHRRPHRPRATRQAAHSTANRAAVSRTHRTEETRLTAAVRFAPKLDGHAECALTRRSVRKASNARQSPTRARPTSPVWRPAVPDRHSPTGSCPQTPDGKRAKAGDDARQADVLAGPEDDLAARVARECVEQGIPVAIDDPVTIAKIMTLMRDGRASKSATKAAKSGRRDRSSYSARGR